MNHSELIKRGWQITWRYRVLWIFGILLALTSGGGGGGSGNIVRGGDGGGLPPFPGWEGFALERWIGVVLLCCCLLLILIIAAIIVQYVARAALYRSVDQIQATGAAPTWREGFRLGWSNRAFRLFLLELLVGIVAFLVVIALLAVAASPLLLLLVDSGVVRALGIAAAVGLLLIAVLIVLVVAVVLSMLGQFWSREVVLADRSVGEALASGYALVRRRLKDVGIMWLLMFAIGLGVGIVMIPVFLAVLAVALGVGGGLGYAIYTVTNSILAAVLAGLPPFFLIMLVPLSIIQGIYLVFDSSVWTLTYRQVVPAS
jgi:hypothetical protein